MTDTIRRPFYTEYAWAYDLIIDRAVRRECAAIVTWLVERNVLPGASLLDAGCGTGRYAIELARRGYAVHGIDRSPDLVSVASAAREQAQGVVSFAVDDILARRRARYDAILCRGVLNDLVDDAEREAAFDGFAAALRPQGVLILDVREWTASAERKAREPMFRKRVSTDRGELTFTSVTELDHEHRRLLIAETHVLVHAERERVSTYQFAMRCWSEAELHSALAGRGFVDLTYFGAYDPTVTAGLTDRLVAVAQLGAVTPCITKASSVPRVRTGPRGIAGWATSCTDARGQGHEAVGRIVERTDTRQLDRTDEQRRHRTDPRRGLAPTCVRRIAPTSERTIAPTSARPIAPTRVS